MGLLILLNQIVIHVGILRISDDIVTADPTLTPQLSVGCKSMSTSL
jgi:hypothetical protein